MIVADPALVQHADLLQGAVAVSKLALVSGRLEAQLRFQLAETRQARACCRRVWSSGVSWFACRT